MVSDYYLVRKGYYDLKQLYSAQHDGLYYGIFGVSWRGYGAYFAGILINIVGFAGAVGVDVPQGALYIYNINYFSGFLVSGAVYWLLAFVFPVPGTSPTWNEVKYQGADMAVMDGKEVDEAKETEEGKFDA